MKVPKQNGTFHLCLNPARLSQALVRLVHRGSTVDGIFSKQTNVCYFTLKDAGSGYHILKLDKKSSCITTFACQFGRYRFTRLPFGVVPVGDMFQ